MRRVGSWMREPRDGEPRDSVPAPSPARVEPIATMAYLLVAACWLALAMVPASLLVACTGLRQQVELRRIGEAAKDDCLRAGDKCPDPKSTEPQRIAQCSRAREICERAAVCSRTTSEAVQAIQKLQEARAKGEPVADLTVTAAGAEVSARARCDVGGWR
jgi:hypothetical protein